METKRGLRKLTVQAALAYIFDAIIFYFILLILMIFELKKLLEYWRRVICAPLNLKGLSWQEKVHAVLKSNYVHVTVIILMIFDSLFVTAQVIIDAESDPGNSSNKASVFNKRKDNNKCIISEETSILFQ